MDIRPLPLKEIAHLSGLQMLQGMVDRTLPAPPFAVTTAITLVSAEEGKVVFEGEPKPAFFNPLGTIHGGWTATIMDSVMACAVHSTLAPGEGYTTLEFKLHFCRPIMPGAGIVRAEGIVLSRGRRAATSEGKLYDTAGKLLAHGTETCLIFDMPGQPAKA
ncbi:MAG: PaaI family thioesterase [Methylocystis sp.]|nr:PaaI family thioesterase [Methylocystis sp.]MCA3583632.1 PaaI family thioesterase [Methylocystis sp.]MCA3586568.1 PaaI family thioesterase [Methylocystis sp.]MCA3593281.1 PaaI family thioesterase [Methylocystis sp.]